MVDIQQRLREIRVACDLGPLSSENLERYWVDTDSARDPYQSVRDSIRLRLEDKKDVRLLFYGHGGCGKSTELAKLVQELGQRYYVVSFSARAEMSLTDVTAEDLIVVLMERLVAAAQSDKLEVDQGALKEVHAYFSTVTTTQEDGSTSKVGIEAGASVKTPFILAQLVKLFAGLKAEIKLEARNKETRVATVRQRPGELLKQANILVNSVRHALPPERQILLIVEDLDKLDISTAREVFIGKMNVLTGINVNIIYTIPIFVFHSPDASILRRQFDSDISLPMIKVAESNGSRGKGFDIVKEIITRRIGADAVAANALDLLIEKTGGVLQHTFEILEIATLMRNATFPLQQEHIRYGLQRKKNEFWSEITLPFEPVHGLTSKEQLFERLRECAESQRKGLPCNPTGDPIDQVLLKSCALVEYNGKRWLGVHPLVQEMIEELGMLK